MAESKSSAPEPSARQPDKAKYVVVDGHGKPLKVSPINVDKQGYGVYKGVIPSLSSANPSKED